jgi:hypothetical protein
MNYQQTLNKKDDDYTTPLEVWANIDEYLPKGEAFVWEAFLNFNSKSAEHLRSLGCNVVYRLL